MRTDHRIRATRHHPSHAWPAPPSSAAEPFGRTRTIDDGSDHAADEIVPCACIAAGAAQRTTLQENDGPGVSVRLSEAAGMGPDQR
jgi:urocanate hydratase